METTANNPTAAPVTEQNQNRRISMRQIMLLFLEYEIVNGKGHKTTVLDSYRNILGRIFEHYDEQTGKFEYTFCDHAGKPMFKSEDLEKLKQEIIKHKAVMMEQAHQRRIEKNLNKSISNNNPFRKKAKREKGILSAKTAKQIEQVVEKVSNESRDVLHTVTDFAGGAESREAELQNIRKGKNRERTQEISR